MSNSFTNQTLAQIELAGHRERYEKKVYVLPKHLDEKVARLHLGQIGARLTELTKEQADPSGFRWRYRREARRDHVRRAQTPRTCRRHAAQRSSHARTSSAEVPPPSRLPASHSWSLRSSTVMLTWANRGP
jgi:hypothetical protein